MAAEAAAEAEAAAQRMEAAVVRMEAAVLRLEEEATAAAEQAGLVTAAAMAEAVATPQDWKLTTGAPSFGHLRILPADLSELGS